MINTIRRSFAFFILCILVGHTLAAATFTVTNTADTGPGSLRQAILDNNSTSGENLILFNIVGVGPFTIQPLTDLPAITNPVIIEGFSQPGANFSNPLIVINGSNYTVGDGVTSGIGLALASGSDGSGIQGLVINEWLLAAISIDTSVNNRIINNHIGTDVTGTTVLANQTGILVTGSAHNVIVSNLIAGSFSTFLGGAGISMVRDLGSIIFNNFIGTDRSGTVALGNSQIGLFIANSENTRVLDNLISGQSIYGIQLLSVTNAHLRFNFIGTDLSGTVALGNLNAGIALIAEGAGLSGFAPTTGNDIRSNLISGNGHGIVVGSLFFNSGTYDNTIQNNLIGTDITGASALGNERQGIWVVDSGNTIYNNLISGNGKNGILVSASAKNNLIIHNNIGTNLSQDAPLGNGKNGIQLGIGGPANGAIANTIGGTVPSQANIISGNLRHGIEILSSSTGNYIQGNVIGADASGLNPIPNQGNGIRISDSPQNIIGGELPYAGNTIAYNLQNGVMVGAGSHDIASVYNAILSNSIFANGKLGITLHKSGNPSSPSPTSHGPNHFQTSPSLKSAINTGTSTHVKGKLTSNPHEHYKIQFFSNETSKNGQGTVFLNEILVKTDSKGHSSFEASIAAVAPGNYISATATLIAASGSLLETSEFSDSEKVVSE